MLFRSRTPVWALSISLAATFEITVVFFSSGYLDVSVHRVPEHTLWIHVCTTKVCLARFPHSEIHGSMLICSSPWLFAAYHVFHRLSVPRHPPCALLRLTCYDTLPSVVMHHLLLVAFRCLVSISMKCLFQNISHGLIDSLIRYSVFKVQTAFMLRKHFVRLKQFGVGFAGKPASSRAFALPFLSR